MGQDLPKFISLFNVLATPKRGARELGKISLQVRGETVAAGLSGVDLEAQFAIGDCYLLFLTDACPFEESLHIYLLNSQYQVIDLIHLGLPFNPGLVTELEPLPDRTVQFSFFGGDRWRLRVLTESSYSIRDAFNTGIISGKPGLIRRRWLKLESVEGSASQLLPPKTPT